MNPGDLVLVAALILMVLMPSLSSLLHELGHALVLLTTSKNTYVMTFGEVGPRLLAIRTARLRLVWRPLDLNVANYRRSWYGTDIMSRRAWIVLHLAGPAISLAMLAGIAALYWLAVQHDPSATAVTLRFSLLWVLIQLILVAIPVRLPVYASASDMLRVRAILRQPAWRAWPPVHPTAETAQRFVEEAH